MTTVLEERVVLKKIVKPEFRNPDEMTIEELTDPDYAKKKLARDFGNGNIDILTCSKCHHCRR